MPIAYRFPVCRSTRPAIVFCLGLLLTALAGCTPRALIQSELADALAAQGQVAEDDPLLARDAAPFYLKLSESVLRDQPGHRALAESVAAGFAGYAYAFVAFEATVWNPRMPPALPACGSALPGFTAGPISMPGGRWQRMCRGAMAR